MLVLEHKRTPIHLSLLHLLLKKNMSEGKTACETNLGLTCRVYIFRSVVACR